MTSSARSAIAAVAIGVLSASGCATGAADPVASMPNGPTVAASTEMATTAPAPTFAANGESVTVQAIDNSFRPDPLEVVAGTEVVFENRGRNDHNVLPKGDPAASMWGVQKEQFAPGDSYAFVFTTPGTYAYYCSIHGTDEIGMVGSIVVTEP